jgi:hypothetical protein
MQTQMGVLHTATTMSDIANSYPTETTDMLYSSILHPAFLGSYAELSNPYQLSTTYTLWPPYYEKRLLCFQFIHPTSLVPYIVGHPVTVTIEDVSIDGVQGHALYGLVRRIESEMDRATWPKVQTKVLVEVHSIPDYLVDWRFARLWDDPPHDIVYIQPHGFLQHDYQPVCILAADDYEDVVKIPQNMVRFLGPEYYAKNIIAAPPHTRLPSPDVYPKRRMERLIEVQEECGVPHENRLTRENIAKLPVEELAKAIAASMMLEEDEEFQPQPAVLPPPLTYNPHPQVVIQEGQASSPSVPIRRREYSGLVTYY